MNLTTTETFLIGVGLVVALLALFELLARLAHTRLLSTIVIGADNRTSTSKVFVLFWTLLVTWALASLFTAGAIPAHHTCALIDATHSIKDAAASCASQGDRVGLLQVGWQRFLDAPLDGSYLVLLGIPGAAAVGAKAITASKDASGTAPKTSAPDLKTVKSNGQTVAAPKPAQLAARITQIFSSDDNTTDLGDFQYLIFNLLAAAFFVATILHVNADGLPQLPDTLLGLTGVSAALYVGKKAADRSAPTITTVFPSTLIAGEKITITGSNLTKDPTVPANMQPQGLMTPEVSIDGTEVAAADVTIDSQVADRIVVKVPAGLNTAAGTVADGSVEVLSAYGFKTAAYAVKVKADT